MTPARRRWCTAPALHQRGCVHESPSESTGDVLAGHRSSECTAVTCADDGCASHVRPPFTMRTPIRVGRGLDRDATVAAPLLTARSGGSRVVVRSEGCGGFGGSLSRTRGTRNSEPFQPFTPCAFSQVKALGRFWSAGCGGFRALSPTRARDSADRPAHPSQPFTRHLRQQGRCAARPSRRWPSSAGRTRGWSTRR